MPVVLKREVIDIRHKLTFFDVDIKSLPTVKSSKLYYKGKYAPDGLFSEQIFGPVKDFICQCKIKNEGGGTCTKCGVKYVKSSKRRHQLAKLNLITEFMNPLFGWLYKLSNKSRSRNQIFRNLYNLI